MICGSRTQTSSSVRHPPPRGSSSNQWLAWSQRAVAELAAEAGEDRDPVPDQPRALEPVEGPIATS